MVEVCIILFSRRRDKKIFVLATVHKDEMENMIPSSKGQHLWRQGKQKGKACIEETQLKKNNVIIKMDNNNKNNNNNNNKYERLITKKCS